ncbi:hypothetical protein WN944_000161 [Citrus x changshan-huyou]|uniref:DNA-directed RNA polymerase n=1 Tax=Citrus x changshan-huyou TaxID=2935761 RepID=A0AAP0MET7_9ROSI
MNQASLECGVFRSESYKAEVDNKDIQSGDIVIGKYAEIGADHSIKLKHTERGLVLKVLLSSNDDGKNFAVVSIRQSVNMVHSPCLGDKFSSMHGQKGVLEAALGKGACDGLMRYATPFATSTGGVITEQLQRKCKNVANVIQRVVGGGCKHERLFTLSDSYQLHLWKMHEYCKCDPTSVGSWVQGQSLSLGPSSAAVEILIIVQNPIMV